MNQLLFELATGPEKAIMGVLSRLQINFIPQYELYGGREVKGGQVGDLYLTDYNIILSILGEYWHYQRGRTIIDKLQAIFTASQGIKTIFIDESDALSNPEFYVKEALRGIQHSKLSRG